jgi:hypothetical protein
VDEYRVRDSLNGLRDYDPEHQEVPDKSDCRGLVNKLRGHVSVNQIARAACKSPQSLGSKHLRIYSFQLLDSYRYSCIQTYMRQRNPSFRFSTLADIAQCYYVHEQQERCVFPMSASNSSAFAKMC